MDKKEAAYGSMFCSVDLGIALKNLELTCERIHHFELLYGPSLAH